MIPGTPALDPDYERCADPGEWQVIYDTNARCYRRERVSRLLWGRATPADPDAAMTPEYLPYGMSAKRAEAQRKNAETLRHKNDLAVWRCLRHYGPQSRGEIANHTGLSDDTVSSVMRRRPDLFAGDGPPKRRLWRALTHDEPGE